MATIPVSVNWGPENTGLGASVEYRVTDQASAVQIAWTNSGVSELVSGSGLYGAPVDFALAWGTIALDWRVNSLSASEAINLATALAKPTSSMLAASYPVFVGFGSGYSGLAASLIYRVVSAAGAILIDWTSDGVTEVEAGTGNYEALVPMSLGWGFVRVLFRINGTALAAAKWINSAQTGYGAISDLLTPIQRKLYTDRISIYRPTERLVEGQGLKPTLTKVYDNVAALFWTTTNFDEQTPAGPMKQANQEQSDRFKTPIGVVPRDQDVISFETPGHPQQGTYHKVQGEPRIKSLLSHVLVFTVPTTVPDLS